MTEARTTNMPSRRAVTKVAAWSAPVIAAAVAAPMAAASQGGGNANRLAWNPSPDPYGTGSGTFNTSGSNKLQIQIFSKSKGLGVGQGFTVVASKGATFGIVAPATAFPYTITGPGYTITFTSSTEAHITSTVAKTAQDFLDVIFPAGTLIMPAKSQVTVTADDNGFANSSSMFA